MLFRSYLLDSNPTVERIAKLIYDAGIEAGLPVVRVRVWETQSSFAEYARQGAVTAAREGTAENGATEEFRASHQ